MAATWRIVLPFLACSTACFFGNGFATDGLVAVGAVFFLGAFSRPLFFLGCRHGTSNQTRLAVQADLKLT
ncbi:hypothetical protein ACHMW4_10780 [Mesorhizobium sp. UC22_110]|uniref:hypothetical protein n=1 Tax=Mesorhizobium sp. UC22_110 TaxID=3374552 RepID=UPI0037567212